MNPPHELTIEEPIAANPPSLKELTKTVDKIIESDTPDEYMRQAGIDLLDIYKELGNIALNAQVYAKDRYGEVLELGPDNKSRLPAIAMILELKKHLKDKSIVTQVGIFNDPKIVGDANRVLSLRDKV